MTVERDQPSQSRSTKQTRYSGPPPECPQSLDSLPPKLTEEQLNVPTSELYSSALEEFWKHKDNGSTITKATEERNGTAEEEEEDGVERYEPDPTRSDRPSPEHYGIYATARSSLDWSYHVVPSKSRQSLQDEIVSYILGMQVKECQEAGDDEPCRVCGDATNEKKGGTAKVGQGDLGCELGDPKRHSGAENGKPLALFTAG